MTRRDELLAWAGKIDNRLGPMPGRDMDAIAALLRHAATWTLPDEAPAANNGAELVSR